LANVINIPIFEEALAMLLTVCNIAYIFIESPKFHAIILSCNYMARDVLLLLENPGIPLPFRV
jgi:hypothetical protein